METFTLPRPRTSRVILGALIGAALFSVTAAATPSWRFRPASSRALLNGFAVAPLATDSLRPVERTFLEKAAEATRGQLRLAELGASQATSTDVRSLAQQIIADHRALGDSITALIRRKGAVVEPPADTSSEIFDRLGEKAGADFDREFVREMAERHAELFALFEYAAADAKDSDVRDLAAAQLPTLRGHRNTIVELMKTLD